MTKQLLRADATLILWHEGEVYRKHTVTLAGKRVEKFSTLVEQ
jgi:hemin uptake protein HemP